LDIKFNLTHSEELAVFAVAFSVEVGVDVEKLDSSRALQEIANRYFSTQERLDLTAVPTDDRVEAFFRCWTRKEAYLKARGDGLSMLSLDSFDVTLLREQEPKVFAPDSSRWGIVSIAPVAGWVGAAVFEGPSSGIKRFFLRPSLTPLV
jgi:4'-phosphopantetheinyl transferase